MHITGEVTATIVVHRPTLKLCVRACLRGWVRAFALWFKSVILRIISLPFQRLDSFVPPRYPSNM